MCEISELEPLIVTSHEKGQNRGVSIYFGVNELNLLEQQGIDIRNNRRFLLQTTTDNKLVLIPFSEVDIALNIEWQLDSILELKKEELEAFAEDLLLIITEEKIELPEKERYSIYQFTKGHYTRYNVRNAVRTAMRANKKATQDLIKKILGKTVV